MKKITTRILACALTVLMIIPTLAFIAVNADESTPATVSFTSPAIPCNTGEKISLSDYSIQMTKDGEFTDNITWSSNDIEIKDGCVTPASVGVYTLTATSANTTKNIYLVAKAPEDTEYVLYSANFDDAEKAKSEISVIVCESAASWTVENGKLVLDASAKTGVDVTLAFPAFLGDFGDYNISSDMTMTKAVNEKRWTSMVFRMQSNTNLYYQMAIRSNATLSNGVELAQHVSSDWNVTHTASYKEALSSSKTYHIEAQVTGSRVGLFIENDCYIYSDTSNAHLLGRVGVSANACRVEYDNFKVTLSDGNINSQKESLYADIAENASNITLSPSVLVNGNVNALASEAEKGAASAVFTVKDTTLALEGGKNVSDVLDAFFGKMIPIFKVETTEVAQSLAKLLKEKSYPDAFVLSSNVEALNAARNAYNLMYGMLDLRKSNETNAEKIAQSANEAQCRAVLLAQSKAPRALVEGIQECFISVFVECTDATNASHVGAIVSGANGILTSDPASLCECFTKFFDKNSIVRSVNIIAHRGLPVKYQENSIAGSIAAYEAGATMIENDVRLTKDGVVVVMHDSTIDRTTSGSGSVAAMTYEQISQYVLNGETGLATQKIPTLEDYFKEFKGKDVKLIVEIKSTEPALITAIKALIDQYDILDQVNFIAFDKTQIARIKQQIPGASCGYLNSSMTVVALESAYYAGEILETVQPQNSTFNPSYKKGMGESIMEQLNHRGLTVWPYTLNAKDAFDEFFLFGISGITTNYSDWVTNVVKTLTAPTSLEANIGEGVALEITQTTYGRKTSAAQNVFMVSLDGSDAVKYENGKFVASAAGTYSVMFGIKSASASGKETHLYTEVLTFTVKDPNAPEDTDTTTSATVCPTTPPTDTTDAPTSAKKGCGGVNAIALLAVTVSALGTAITVVITKKSR